jgi:hypothetical protein
VRSRCSLLHPDRDDLWPTGSFAGTGCSRIGHFILPFFENLLPEGWLLELSTSKLKISKDDAFGLLLATCAGCIGAVEVVADGTRT